MFQVFPAISGALAVLVVVAGLFLWFADRGRGPEEVVLTLPEMVNEAAGPDEAAVSGQEHATAQQNGTESSADNEKIVGGEVARLRELLESTTDDLEDLATAAGEIGDAETLSSNSAEDFSGGSDLNDGEPLSLSADVAAWAVGSEGEFSQSFSPIEEPREKVSPPPQTVPHHGQLARFEFGVITRSSNLREGPNVESAIVARLSPGSRIQVLEAKPVFGYYRVLSEGQDGWVWWLNVDPGNPENFW